MKVRPGSVVGFSLRAAVTIGLLWFISTRIELGQVYRDFRSSAWWGPAGAALLMVVNLILQWARWHLVVIASRLGLSGRQTLKMMLAGLPLGLATPGRMGELGRGLAVEGSHDALSVAGLTVLERGFSFAGSLGIAILAMIASGYGTGVKWAAILALYSLYLFAMLHPYRMAAWGKSLALRLPGALGQKADSLGERLLKGWDLAGRKAALAVLFVSVLQTLVALFQMTLCFLAVAGPTPALKVFGAWAVVLGAKHFFPVTVGDIGVREGLAIAIFANRDLSTSAAVVAALLIYVINVLFPSLIGVLVLARRRPRS